MVIRNCKLFDGTVFADGLKDVAVDETNGIIAGIFESGDVSAAGESLDAKGRTVCPGYVDIHTHGIGGIDNSDLEPEMIPVMSRLYNNAGTTTYVPSLPTISMRNIQKALAVYEKHDDSIPGVHLEGPFINSQKRGAQNPVHILRPSIEAYKKAVGEFGGSVIRVTIAPELDEGFRLTDYLVSKGIKVSFGHTVCPTDLAVEFFEKTDSIGTHMFNAMPSIHHRSPSITTVALNSGNVCCEIIPDLIHIHPQMIKLIFKMKGSAGTVAVSDSMLAAGLADGEYTFSGLDVTVTAGSARLKAGNLAGSIITMADGVKNIISCGIRPEDALASATSAPAGAMGFKSIGYIRERYKADILILTEDYSVDAVVKSGKLLHS